MNCDELKDLLAERPAEVSAGDAAGHVAGCGECRDTVRAIAMVRTALAEIPRGHPQAETLDAIRRAARSAVTASEESVFQRPARGSAFWAWLLGPAMRPALGFAAVGAVALAVVVSMGTDEKRRSDDLSGPPRGLVAAREEARAPAASPGAEASGSRRPMLVVTQPPTAAHSAPSPGGLSAAPVAEDERNLAKPTRPSLAVVTPATKELKDRPKKLIWGTQKASSGEALAEAKPAVPPPAEEKRADPVANAEPKGVDTSRGDRIGLREETRESATGQEIARATGAGTAGGGAGGLGSAMGPSGRGYETRGSMRQYDERAPTPYVLTAKSRAAATTAPAAPAPDSLRLDKDAAKKAESSRAVAQAVARDTDDAQSAAEGAVNAKNFAEAQRIIVPRYGKIPREPQIALLLAETHIALKQWKDAAVVLESLLERLAEGPHVDRVLALLEKVYEAQRADEKLRAVRAKRSSRSR